MVAEAISAMRRTFPGLLTILAPRHPKRGDSIADLLGRHGLAVARRSANEAIAPTTAVYLVDTLGDLGLVYRLAEIAFVGGSLAPHGGHNPLEPARLDCALVTGRTRRISRRPTPRWRTPTQSTAWQTPIRSPPPFAPCSKTRLRGPGAQPPPTRPPERLAARWRRRSALSATISNPAAAMRAPAFWAVERGGIAAAALTPLSCLYRLGARGHAALARPAKAGLPVICVGNFTVGGAGKTPTVLALAALLAEEGIHPHILTRGYGGSERGPLRVDPARHDARAVGDEALLLARVAPTWLSRDRAAGAAAAHSAGAPLLLMDDGMQTPGLLKDLCIAVVGWRRRLRQWSSAAGGAVA